MKLNLDTLKKASVVTSNMNKFLEFKEILGDELKIEKGLDLKEVQSDSLTVIFHKSADAGDGYIVEDTLLVIEGREVVDIRYKINELQNMDKVVEATWIVNLGYNDGQYIYVFESEIKGVLKPSDALESFGFDPYFYPEGQSLSLDELAKRGRKLEYSARNRAVIRMLNGEFSHGIRLEELKKWEGDYQS